MSRRDHLLTLSQLQLMNQTIIITEQDAIRLRPIVQRKPLLQNPDYENLPRLKAELDRASIVMQEDLPNDVVAMNSFVELEDLTDGEILTFQLVYPEHAEISEGRISILAPLGMAMLGYRVGDEIEWPVPAGTARVRIRKVTNPKAQPETALRSV